MSIETNQMPGWLVHPGPAAYVAYAAAGLVLAALIATLVVVAARLARRARTAAAAFPPEDRLTILGALMATGISLEGMWRITRHRLHLSAIEAGLFCGFLEVAMVSSALRARRNIREHGSAGIDGTLVWVFAALTGLFGASVADGMGALVRFSAPIVAAGMWERSLNRMRARQRPDVPKSIAWKWTTERLAVWLGLAEPAERTTTEVAAARRIARLIRTRIALAGLQGTPHSRILAALTIRDVRAGMTAARLRNQSLAAVEHLRLGQDPAVMERITATVAAVVLLPDLTNPTTVGKPTKRADRTDRSDRTEPAKPRTTTAPAPKAHVLPPGPRAVLAADEDRDVITETVPEPPPGGDLNDRIAVAAADAKSRGGDNKEAIAAMLALDPALPNAAMGRVLGISGEAVRQARVRLAAASQEA